MHDLRQHSLDSKSSIFDDNDLNGETKITKRDRNAMPYAAAIRDIERI